MKTTNLNINKETNEVNVTITLPFVVPDYSIEDGETSASDIIAAGRNVLIEALRAHQNAAIEKLLLNKDNIIFNDGTTIVYELPDNETGTFSTAAYTIIEAAINELKDGSCRTFSLNKQMIREAIKALCEYRQSGLMFQSTTCYDLISALLDCLEND